MAAAQEVGFQEDSLPAKHDPPAIGGARFAESILRTQWSELYDLFSQAGEWERKLMLFEARRLIAGQKAYGKWFPGKVTELARNRLEERVDDRIYELFYIIERDQRKSGR